MGFIKNNTNTFEVYLTDLGKQRFFDGGLKDAITHFSLVDSSNYDIFKNNPNEVLSFVTGETYEINSVVKFNNKYYRKKTLTNTQPNTPADWEEVLLFNPIELGTQSIPTINHANTYKTSLGNSEGTFINDVFTQTSLRGSFVDNMLYKNALFGVKSDTQSNYVMYEPNFNSEDTITLITYINV
jgi:hypothetical protein